MTPQQHCSHECVCNKYIDHTNTGATPNRVCNGETWCFKPCPHDTRASHSAAAEPPAPIDGPCLMRQAEMQELLEKARAEGAKSERERVLGVSVPAYGIKSHGTVQLSTVRRDDEECYRYAAYNHIPSFEVVRVRVIEEESLRDGGEPE